MKKEKFINCFLSWQRKHLEQILPENVSLYRFIEISRRQVFQKTRNVIEGVRGEIENDQTKD